MAELGSYYITIMPSMKGFTSAVNKELGGLGTSGGKSFAGSFADVLKGSAIGTALGNLATKAGSAIMDGLKTGIGRLDTLKNFPKVMEGLGYSTTEADKSIKMIMDHLDGLPTSTQDMVTLTQAISDSTGDLDLATRAALGFNDMMLANGASSAEMANAQGVLNRVLGKGSATAQQWQSICSVMPAQLGQVARHMLGAEASTEDLHAALENGTVSWNDFLKAIVELDEQGEGAMDSFYQQAVNNSVGIGTALENIPNRIGAGWAKILEAIGQQEISGVINNMSYGIRDALGGVATVIEDLKQKFADLGTFEKFQTVMGMLGDKFGSFGSAVSDAVSRAVPVIAELIDKGLQWIIDHGDSIGNFIDTIAGAFGKVAETISGALSGAMPVLGNLVDKALTWILDHGEVVVALLGAMAAKMAFEKAGAAAGYIGAVVDKFRILSNILPNLDSIQELPDAFGFIADKGGPLAGLFSKLSSESAGLLGSFNLIKGLPSFIGEELATMGGSASGLGSTLASVATGPVGIAVAAIAGIALAIKTLWDTNEGFRNTVTSIWNGIVSKFTEAGAKIGKAFEPMAGAIGPAFETLLSVIGQVWQLISEALGPGIVTLFAQASAVIGGFVDVVAGIFQVIGGIIQGFQTGDWTMFTDGLKSIWDGFWSVITSPIQGAFEGIKYFLEQIGYDWDTLVNGIKSAWEGITGFFSGIWETVKTGIGDFCKGVGEKWDGLKTAAGNTWDALKKQVSDGVKNATDNWHQWQSDLDNTTKQMGSDIRKGWTDITTTIGNQVRTITSNASKAWSDFTSNLRSKNEEIRQNALNAWNAIKTNVGNIAEGIHSTVVDKFNAAKNAALGVFDGIKDGICDKIRWAKDRVSEIIDGIRNLFNFSWSLPAPSLPHIEWHWEKIGDVLSLPVFDGVSWYAKGGVFDSAALIGIGEAGREAALPLNAKTYGEIAKGIVNETHGMEGVTVNVYGLTVREEADVRRIADELNRMCRRERMAVA